MCWGRFILCRFFGRVLIINGCWILSKDFSASVEIVIWFLSFSLLTWCVTLINFHILKNPCVSRINTTWSCSMNFLMCCWILFAEILLRILHLCSWVILTYCSFLFLCCPCPVLVSGWWWPHGMSLEVLLPLQFFERVLKDRH